MKKIAIYDSTLRDGAQAQGISYSVEDKVKIVEKLDALGVHYIEAGNPGSNPKDLEFFERVRGMKLKHAKLIAFGATRKIGIKAEDDGNVRSILAAGTDAVAIFGKSWDYQVTEILRTKLDENLRMIGDTVRFSSSRARKWSTTPSTSSTASSPTRTTRSPPSRRRRTPAPTACACATPTAAPSPTSIFDITKKVAAQFKTPIGIHCHNDCEMAVANSVMAVQAGATQVQGTINGIGERCGNANLCSIIPDLQLKLGFECIPPQNMATLTTVARAVSDIANMPHNEKAAYVGADAFAHKGGMHVDAVVKNPVSYEHIDPDLVGNSRRTLMSEVAGRSTLLARIQAVDPAIGKDSPETKKIIERLKQLEHEGYHFEAAEQSFELVVRKMLGRYKPFFELVEFKVMVNEPSVDSMNSSAMIKIRVGDDTEITAAEGDGPVNALDKAVRKALERFYPAIGEIRLTDYKVRVLDSKEASAAKVRVLIESTDHRENWTTIGVSTDIIDASWQALVDSIEYKLVREQEAGRG
jgi:2-isopropylmalate synthase